MAPRCRGACRSHAAATRRRLGVQAVSCRRDEVSRVCHSAGTHGHGLPLRVGQRHARLAQGMTCTAARAARKMMPRRAGQPMASRTGQVATPPAGHSGPLARAASLRPPTTRRLPARSHSAWRLPSARPARHKGTVQTPQRPRGAASRSVAQVILFSQGFRRHISEGRETRAAYRLMTERSAVFEEGRYHLRGVFVGKMGFQPDVVARFDRDSQARKCPAKAIGHAGRLMCGHHHPLRR